jgi:hypothetical protein
MRSPDVPEKWNDPKRIEERRPWDSARLETPLSTHPDCPNIAACGEVVHDGADGCFLVEQREWTLEMFMKERAAIFNANIPVIVSGLGSALVYLQRRKDPVVHGSVSIDTIFYGDRMEAGRIPARVQDVETAARRP